MIGLLMLTAAAMGPSPADAAFAEQVKRCGITSDHVVWSTDDHGKPIATITPNGDLENFSFRSVKCLLDWAQQNGRHVGFISEPPPAPFPASVGIEAVQRAAIECGAAISSSPASDDAAANPKAATFSTLQIDPHATRAERACLAQHLPGVRLVPHP